VAHLTGRLSSNVRRHTRTPNDRRISMAAVTSRIIVWVRLLLAGLFCIPAALILVNAARDRFGGQSVLLSASSDTCGAAPCFGDQCTRIHWLGSDTLRVTTIVYIGTTAEVAPEGASAVVSNGVVRLLYNIRARNADRQSADGPVPACLMPVSLAFSLSGLPRQPYVVTTSARSLLADCIGVGFATVLLWVAWRLSAPAMRRSKRQRAPEAQA
jgi:hypothetical protein